MLSIQKNITILVSAVTLCSMMLWVPLKCLDCKTRTVNPEFDRMYAKARTGDLLLVKSNDFFSKMIRDIDDCQFAGVKLVYEIAPGSKALIVSDADDLSDRKKGLLAADMREYFDDYNHLELALFRPTSLSAEILQNIDELSERALDGIDNPVAYDFAFRNDDRSAMTCSKIILSAFGEENLLDRSLEKTRIFVPTTSACDLKMDKLEQVFEWIPYWKN